MHNKEEDTGLPDSGILVTETDIEKKRQEIREGIVVRLMAADEEMAIDKAQGFWVSWKRALLFEPYADGKHCGDCTKEPHTCMRCLVGDYYGQADEIIKFQDSRGVVILNPDKSLPIRFLHPDDKPNTSYGLAQQDMLRVKFAGYESLIPPKEVSDDRPRD